MARLEDLSLTHRLFVETYPFRKVDWAPGARLAKPLSQSKLALISSAGVYLPGQAPFDLAFRGGDFSFRELPNALDVRLLKIAQRSSDFDQKGAGEDANLVFPLDRFRELVEQGEIGGLNHRHFSFMGSISAPGRLISDSAPQVAKMLHEDGDFNLYDITEDEDAEKPGDHLDQTLRDSMLQSWLDQLGDKERDVVRLRYGLGVLGEPQTLESIGQHMGVTRERIRQIQVGALQKLRRTVEALNIHLDDLV